MPRIAVNYIYVKGNVTGDEKLKMVEIFSQTMRGSRIVHAESGYPMQCILGSRNQDMLFHLKYAIGNQIPSFEPLDLFYNSPEEAERHLCTIFSPATKARFQEKFV